MSEISEERFEELLKTEIPKIVAVEDDSTIGAEPIPVSPELIERTLEVAKKTGSTIIQATTEATEDIGPNEGYWLQPGME